MPALLPAILAAHVILTAQEVPRLDVETSCHDAARAAVRASGDASKVCLHDEQQARAKLKTEWRTFNGGAQSRCLEMTRTGGPPSYVELLTCLELAKAARTLPHEGLLDRAPKQ